MGVMSKLVGKKSKNSLALDLFLYGTVLFAFVAIAVRFGIWYAIACAVLFGAFLATVAVFSWLCDKFAGWLVNRFGEK